MLEDNFKIDFIGIGDQRAASTWIFQCLREHPEICGPRIKETQFFDREDFYKKGIEFYKSFFKDCPADKVIGEYSPSYLHRQGVPERIKRYFPDVKLIVCLRCPAEKVYSLYWFNKTGGTGSMTIYESFEEAIKKSSSLVNDGFYYSFLKKYFELFPKENILITIYEDIQKDPVKFIQNIYKFLGVKENFVPSSVRKKINVIGNRKFRFPLLSKAIVKSHHFLQRYSITRKIINRINTYKFLSTLNRLNIQTTDKAIRKPPMNPDTRKYLQEIYQEDIKKLEKLIKRDLSFWLGR